MLKKSDEQFHQDVLWELKWDSRVTELEVGVEVDDGIVTLTGNVDSFAKKLAASRKRPSCFISLSGIGNLSST